MNVSYYIAKRLVFHQQRGFSRFIIIISLVATLLSVATMIVSSSMVKGFRHEIANKIYGFWGHIQIRSFETFNGYDDEPLAYDATLVQTIKSLDEVQSTGAFALKPCILKTENEIESLILKGVDEQAAHHSSVTIIEGMLDVKTDTSGTYKLVISQQTALRLQLKTGDKITVYFAANINGNTQLLIRNAYISGIYKSGLTDFDKIYALCSLNFIQRVNKWPENRITGYEVFLKKNIGEKEIKRVASSIHENNISTFLSAKALSDLYPNLFDWLELQKTNEIIIIILMTLVAIVNLITMLLILILERARFIGLLKSIGARTTTITRIFIYQSAYVVLFGIFLGNILGIGICLIQQYTHFIKLDEETYFVSYAPIYFDWIYILLINVTVFVVSLLTLLLPALVISSIQPSKVLRFS